MKKPNLRYLPGPNHRIILKLANNETIEFFLRNKVSNKDLEKVSKIQYKNYYGHALPIEQEVEDLFYQKYLAYLELGYVQETINDKIKPRTLINV